MKPTPSPHRRPHGPPTVAGLKTRWHRWLATLLFLAWPLAVAAQPATREAPGAEDDSKDQPSTRPAPSDEKEGEGQKEAERKGERKGEREGEGEGEGESKSEGDSDNKSEGKGEGKSEGKGEGKSEGKGEGKSEGKGEGKSEGKGEGEDGNEGVAKDKNKAGGEAAGTRNLPPKSESEPKSPSPPRPRAKKKPKAQKPETRKSRKNPKEKAKGKPKSKDEDEEEEEAGVYSTVVVSGVRPEVVMDSPRSVEALSKGDLVRRGARSTPEILENTPGVVVQKTNHGGGSPFIRGLTGQHVLILIDGIRLNNSTTRYGPNQALNTIDAFTLRRVEVLRGPGSVLYGSDAIGGAIQLLTRDAPMIPGAGFRWGGVATARMSTADRSQIYNVGAWTQYKMVGVSIGGSFKHFNDLTGGRGVGKQKWTGYDEGGWDGAVKVLLGGDWVLKVATSGIRQTDVPRTDKCSAQDFRFFTHQNRELAYVKLTGSKGRFLDRLQAVVSYQRTTELRHRFRLGKDRIERGWDRVHTAGMAVTAGMDLGKYSKLTYGADLYHDWVFSTARRETITTGVVSFMEGSDFRGRFVDGSTYLQGGLFAYDEIKPLSWMVFHLGGRVALSHATIPADPLAGEYGFESKKITKTFVGPVGGASVTFIPTKVLHLITSVQQGFRAPNLDDYSHVGSEGPAFDVPSPDLDKAETSTTLEVGAKLAWRGLSAWAFGHYSFLRDFIARRYTGETVDGEPAAERANAAKGYVAGVEGYLGYRFPKGFSADTWISWTRGDIKMPFQDPKTQPIRRLSPLQGAASVSYLSKKRKWARVTLRWSARQDRLSPGDLNDKRICPNGPEACTGTPGFAIVNLSGGLPLNRYVDFSVHIHNLTNEKYKFHGSGVYGPGLSAMAQLRIKYQ